MLKVSKLLEAVHGLDPNTPVVVGIIEGEGYNAADA